MVLWKIPESCTWLSLDVNGDSLHNEDIFKIISRSFHSFLLGALHKSVKIVETSFTTRRDASREVVFNTFDASFNHSDATVSRVFITTLVLAFLRLKEEY